MPKVLVYSSDSCGYCHKAKAFLTSLGVSFVERNVDKDKTAQFELMQLKAKGVPLIKVDDEVIFGFDQVRLEKLLAKLVIECPSCHNKLRIPKNKGLLKVTCPKCKDSFKTNSST